MTRVSKISCALALCLLQVPLCLATSATISVNSAQQVRTIPATLFGTNLEWIWNGDGLWNGTSLDTRFAPLIQQASPTLYRFPGGLFADYYNWQNGVGPQSRRPASQSLPGGAVSANSFGTDEAQQVAKQFGGKLLITVNAGTGTAAMAAAWVQYVNGGSHGPHVDYWEIGNELYIPATSIGGVGIASMTATQYVSTLIQYARAMKAVDPTIKIGAILDESASTRQSSPWTTTVLTGAGNYIDFVAVHNAYAPNLPVEETANVMTVYQAMLAAPVLIGQDLQSLASRIDELVPDRAGQIPIAVTEWGASFQIDRHSPYIDHVKTMGSALYTASALMAFIRSPRTQIANHFKLSDALNMGMMGLRNNGAPAAAASLYAMQIFTTHTGPRLIASTVVSPVFSTAGAGSIGPVTGVPYLDVISTLSADGKHCFVTAVNRDLSSSIEARISLGSLIPSGPATSWTVSGSAIDANPGTKPPAGYVLVPDAVWSRFENGGPNEVTLTSSTVPLSSGSFTYQFPAASIVSIDIPVNKSQR